MTQDRRRAGRFVAGWMVAALCLLVQSCAKPPPPPASTARLFASDLSGGAKRCEVPSVTPAAGKDTPVAMSVGNDGGWCGITVANDGKPFAAGLLASEPAHGKVFIHTVGDATRIDYTPDTQFTGGDAFAVRLLPGDATLRVSVTVAAR